MPYMRNTLTQTVLGPMAADSPEYQYLRGLKNGRYPLYEDVPFQDSGQSATAESRSIQALVGADAAAVDMTAVIGSAPYAGKVTGVAYIPEAAVTGANTNTRTLSLTNAGSGGGSTNVASLALISGNNLVANAANAIPLSGTPSHLVVAAGDEIEFSSVHAGTGLADPGGLVVVTFSRD